MRRELSETQFLALRLCNQALLPQIRSARATAAAIVGRQVAFQAQDLGAARLGVGARSNTLTDDRIERTRTGEQSIVQTWCMRGTLQLLARADARWILSLIGPAVIEASRSRLAQVGLRPAACVKALAIVREIFANAEALTRDAVAEALAARGVALVGQGKYHLLRLAALHGLICVGPYRDGAPSYVKLGLSTDAISDAHRDELLGRLIHRYLKAHAPAQLDDFVTWSGLNASLVRRVWDRISAEFEWVTVKRRSYAILETQLRRAPEAEAMFRGVRLLPRFDAYLLGYRHRDMIVRSDFIRLIQPGGGVMHPFVLVDGRVAGVWALKTGRAGARLQVKPFVRLARPALRAIEAEHERLDHFLAAATELEIRQPQS